MTQKLTNFLLFFFPLFTDDDFIDFCDLFLACIILQKQIERIDGKKENIIIPNIAIKQFRENQQAGNDMKFVCNKLLIVIIL